MKLALLSAFIMCLGVAGILVSTLLFVHTPASSEDNRTDYAILLDCGSTGTRAYIYQWHHRTSNTLPPIGIATIENGEDELIPQTMEIHPGIDTFADNPSGVTDYLQPLIDWAHDQLEELPHAYSPVPIHLMATGGLRVLSSTQSAAILTQARYALSDSNFYFETSWADILDGSMEAYYGFVSVNALYNYFEDNNSPQSSFGSIELGGVSAEIAYVPSGTVNSNCTVTQDINGTLYTVFVQSQDGLGINAARYAYNASLYSANQTLVVDPCLPVNFTENVVTTIDGQPASFTLIGASNPDLCSASVKTFVDDLTQNLSKPNFGSTRFITIDKYIKVKDFFKLKDNANIVELSAKVDSFCSLGYEDALAHHSKYADSVQYYCFNGNYIASLLADFYGFNTALRQITWRDNIKKYPVSWTLGAAVDLVTEITPDTKPYSPGPEHTRFVRTDGGVVVLFISILCFLLGFILFVLQRQRHHQHSQYVAIA